MRSKASTNGLKCHKCFIYETQKTTTGRPPPVGRTNRSSPIAPTPLMLHQREDKSKTEDVSAKDIQPSDSAKTVQRRNQQKVQKILKKKTRLLQKRTKSKNEKSDTSEQTDPMMMWNPKKNTYEHSRIALDVM